MTSKNDDNSGSNVVPTRWNQKFGSRLKERRELFGLSQVELAENIGANKSTIQNYEKGDSPSGKYLALLAKELECTTGWLLMGEGPEPDPPVDDEAPKTAPIYNKVEEFAGRVLHVAAPDQEYEKHGGWKPRPEMNTNINRMLGFTYQILSSESIYSNALAANINAFYGALVAEKDLKDTLKIQTDEIESLKNTCDDLRQRIAALEHTKQAYVEDNSRIRDYDPPEKKEGFIKMRMMSSL